MNLKSKASCHPETTNFDLTWDSNPFPNREQTLTGGPNAMVTATNRKLFPQLRQDQLTFTKA